MNRYYVYAIAVDGVVRYIGKGSSCRAQQHMQIVRRIARLRAIGKRVKAEYFHNKLCKAWSAGGAVDVRIIVGDLNEDEAYARERHEIEGLRAQLWNQKAGGKEGGVYTPELRRRLSDAAKRRYQDPLQRAEASRIARELINTPAARAKRSATQKRRFADGDPLMWRFNASSHTPEVYKRRGATLKKTLAARPDIVTASAKKSKAWWSDPINKERASAGLRAAHARPDVKAKRRAYYDSPEGRGNLKAAAEAGWAKRRAETAT